MRPDQIGRWLGWRFVVTLGVVVLAGSSAWAQIPPPQLGLSNSPDLVAQRASILRDEQTRRAALGGPKPDQPARTGADGSTRFVPLSEVVSAAEISASQPSNPAEVALGLSTATQLFDLAQKAAAVPEVSLAFVDDCLRGVLARQPGHAEARRLLGFVPYDGKGWATPFAVEEMKRGKVKDPKFGWVFADWMPHLNNGELPAPSSGSVAAGSSRRWLPVTEADALRRDWPRGWTIYTEHFEIHANVPFADAIAFGHQLETFHQLFFAIMADLIGPQSLPLAQRLRSPGLQPTVSKRPQHKVCYFANRDDYRRNLAPVRGGAKDSLGIYLPKKDFGKAGEISYFFDDVGGQLDVSATLYHEVSHQLLFESAGSTDYDRNQGNFWVFEGLGTYFETVQVDQDGAIRVGGLVGPRLAVARQRMITNRDFVPIGPFVAMDRAAFLGDLGGDVYLHYAEAMALAVYLMQNHDGRDRESFLDYARDAFRGQFRGNNGRPLHDRLDRPYPEVQRDLFSFLARYPVSSPSQDAQPSPKPQH